MPGAVLKLKRDIVVADIAERDKKAARWTKANNGQGIVVLNSFDDPEVGENVTAYYKWTGTTLKRITAATNPLAVNEYFVGDGVKTEFILSTGRLLIVEVGGQILEPGQQYIREDNKATFLVAPEDGERIGLIGVSSIKPGVFDETFDETFG